MRVTHPALPQVGGEHTDVTLVSRMADCVCQYIAHRRQAAAAPPPTPPSEPTADVELSVSIDAPETLASALEAVATAPKRVPVISAAVAIRAPGQPLDPVFEESSPTPYSHNASDASSALAPLPVTAAAATAVSSCPSAMSSPAWASATPWTPVTPWTLSPRPATVPSTECSSESSTDCAVGSETDLPSWSSYITAHAAHSASVAAIRSRSAQSSPRPHASALRTRSEHDIVFPPITRRGTPPASSHFSATHMDLRSVGRPAVGESMSTCTTEATASTPGGSADTRRHRRRSTEHRKRAHSLPPLVEMPEHNNNATVSAHNWRHGDGTSAPVSTHGSPEQQRSSARPRELRQSDLEEKADTMLLKRFGGDGDGMQLPDMHFSQRRTPRLPSPPPPRRGARAKTAIVNMYSEGADSCGLAALPIAIPLPAPRRARAGAPPACMPLYLPSSPSRMAPGSPLAGP